MGAEAIRIFVDGREFAVEAGQSLAAALLGAGITVFRLSVSGEPRGPVCGMGVCHECRVTVDGIAQRRACLELVRDGMEVTTR